MIRIPDPGRFELRLMDGSSNPYLLQAGVIAAGIYGLNNKIDPGEPLSCNMYTEYKKYPDLKQREYHYEIQTYYWHNPVFSSFHWLR